MKKTLTEMQNILAEVGDNHAVSRFRSDLIKMAIMLTVSMLIAGILNFYCKPLNGLIGFVMAVALMIGTMPRTFKYSFLFGAVTGRGDSLDDRITAGISQFKEINAHFMCFLTWASAVFMFGATLSFEQNPGAVLIALPCLMLIGLSEYGWNYKTHIGRPIVFIYAAIVVIVSFGSIVPKGLYYRTLGFNPYSYFQTSTIEEKEITEMEALEKKGIETPAEQARYDALKKKLSDKSLVGKGQKILTERAEAEAKKQADIAKSQAEKEAAAKLAAAAIPAPAAASTGHYGEPDRNNIRVISETTATPIPPGKGQTTACWYAARGNGKRLQLWADNHNFTIVTANGSRYYAWHKPSMDLWNSRVLDEPYYLINESDQAVNATAKIETV